MEEAKQEDHLKQKGFDSDALDVEQGGGADDSEGECKTNGDKMPEDSVVIVVAEDDTDEADD